MNAEYKQNIDKYLDKNSKVYFLLKRLIEYEARTQYHSKRTICDVRQYERKWKKLSQKYKKVDVYGIEFVGIGETISRLFMYLRDRKKETKIHIILFCLLFLPTTQQVLLIKRYLIYSRSMFTLLRRIV